MYDLKPILKTVQIDLPTCMYHMKPTIGHSEPTSSHTQSTVYMDPISEKIRSLLKADESAEMQELAMKQEKILKQLAELKQQLLSMRTDLKLCNKPAQPVQQSVQKSAAVKVEPINLSYLQDFVVNASPANVPYSILALKNMWINRLNLQVECFTHSTVTALSEEALKFQQVITALEPKDTNLPKIKVTLIWKDVGPYTEMITSPTSYVPICGEVNILRFLSRAGPSEFNYEKLSHSTEMDTILDACYLLINQSNVKDRQSTLRILNSRLGKCEYFGGESISICDIAATSAIKQVQAILSKDINPNMSKLLHKVSQAVGF